MTAMMLALTLSADPSPGFIVTPGFTVTQGKTEKVGAPKPEPTEKEVTPPKASEFRIAFEAAKRDRAPLYVWVDYWCPSSALQIAGAHHHRVNGKQWTELKLQGTDGVWRETTVEGPAVVVLKPDAATGGYYREKTVAAKDCCAASLTSGAGPTVQASRSMGGG